jgi:hypothetical protein
LNSDPPDLCSWIVRITDINHQPLAHCVLFKVGIVLGESRLEAKFSSAFLNSQKHKWFFFFYTCFTLYSRQKSTELFLPIRGFWEDALDSRQEVQKTE